MQTIIMREKTVIQTYACTYSIMCLRTLQLHFNNERKKMNKNKKLNWIKGNVMYTAHNESE